MTHLHQEKENPCLRVGRANRRALRRKAALGDRGSRFRNRCHVDFLDRSNLYRDPHGLASHPIGLATDGGLAMLLAAITSP